MSLLLEPSAPASAVAEVDMYGSTVIRGAWRRDHLHRLLSAIESFVALRAERVARGAVGRSDRLLHAHGAGGFANLVAEGLIETSVLREMFEGGAYHQICREYFQDDELYVQPARLLFRNHHPRDSKRSFVPYHQDSGSQDPRILKVLNCWIPLDPGAGLESPGLEVVRHPAMPNFPLKEFGLESDSAVYDFITIDRDKIVEVYGEDQFLAPVFEVGDGFVFSQDVIHRTYVTPEMAKPRRNFEFRVFSMKHLAPDASADDVRQSAVRVG